MRMDELINDGIYIPQKVNVQEVITHKNREMITHDKQLHLLVFTRDPFY